MLNRPDQDSRRAQRVVALLARIVVFATLALSTASCGKNTTEPSGRGIRMLFVGNSLVADNALPELVRMVAALMGDTAFVRSETAGGTALIDHLNGASQAVQALEGGAWDFVVLSQGPTPRGICRDSLVLWTMMFDPFIRKSGARSAVLMTWPASSARPKLFDEVRISFQQAALAVNGTFLPAGEAWRIAWEADATLPLYGGDGFHPSALGSLLAALEIHGRLSGRNMRTLPVARLATIAPRGTTSEQLRILIEAAQLANERFNSPLAESTDDAIPSARVIQSC